MLYTFELIDGRKVTYGGATELAANNKARAYHGDAVSHKLGAPAHRCECSSKRANNVRQDGWLTCADCGGYLS